MPRIQYSLDDPYYYHVEDMGYFTPCWVWNKCICWGYGYITVLGKVRRAHRVYYERAKGPIPEGLVIDHLCRIRSCVNPDHLEAVTQQVNVLRGDSQRVARERERPKSKSCSNGHLYTEETSYIRPDGERNCRLCKKLYLRMWKKSKKDRSL